MPPWFYKLARETRRRNSGGYESKAIDPVIVAKEKAQTVKKSGLLELIETKENLDSIGGLDVLKEWLLKRRHAFSQRAIEYGLPTRKGLLILGIAGTGKSLTAKATAKVFGVPLLKVRIKPSGRHSSCRSHRALLPLDR